ncbi:MAG: hypothetical protein NTW64_01830 [Candidatus Omnitrophica bacterium]|nr:hypothetical protein [Candidatus Omnitrophota bacterium]
MCPNIRKCALIMAGFVLTEIVTCGFEKESCPYLKNKLSDEPVTNIIKEQFPVNAVAIASGSPLFLTSGIGQQIADLPDGRKLFYFRPEGTNIGGKFKVVNGGNEVIIDFRIPEA